MPPFDNLLVWKAAHEVVLSIYRATDSWPKCELYGLTMQARRAAVSVAANISEGVAKRGQKELRRFLDISLGSMSELTYILLVARDLGILAQADWQRIEDERDHAGKLLWGLYKSVRSRLEEPPPY